MLLSRRELTNGGRNGVNRTPSATPPALLPPDKLSPEMIDTVIDPALIPKRALYTGALMPAIGLGTFGSDHVSADQHRGGRAGALSASATATSTARRSTATKTASAPRCGDVLAGGLKRDELWITSKLWNDKHGEQDVIPSCRKSLADLRPGLSRHVSRPLAVPQFPSAGVRCRLAQSRRAALTSTTTFMKTWRQMEKLVDLGLVRHIGTSNMTIPKLEAAAARCADQAGRQRNGAASALPAAGAVRLRARQRHPAGRLLSGRLAEPPGARPHAGRYCPTWKIP